MNGQQCEWCGAGHAATRWLTLHYINPATGEPLPETFDMPVCNGAHEYFMSDDTNEN